jgi:hypothetical protein
MSQTDPTVLASGDIRRMLEPIKVANGLNPEQTLWALGCAVMGFIRDHTTDEAHRIQVIDQFAKSMTESARNPESEIYYFDAEPPQ